MIRAKAKRVKHKAKGKGATAKADGVQFLGEYANEMTTAAALESNIEMDHKWAWCKEQQANKKFSEAWNKIKAAARADEFSRIAMSENISALRKKYSEAELEVNFKNLTTVLAPLMKTLSAEMDKLQKWHDIHLAYEDDAKEVAVHCCHGPRSLF